MEPGDSGSAVSKISDPGFSEGPRRSQLFILSLDVKREWTKFLEQSTFQVLL
jgi:hypothetical protein